MDAAALFRKTRVRLFCEPDDVVINGWVTDITKTQLIFDTPEEPHLEPGLQAQVEIYGAKFNLKAVAKFRCYVQKRVVCDLSNISVLPASEAVRITVPHYLCSLDLDGLRGEATAVDISIGGIGLISSARVSAGEVLQVEMQTPHGLIAFSAEVRYCRPTNELEFEFRIGAKITFKDRIDHARWMNLFTNQLAA